MRAFAPLLMISSLSGAWAAPACVSDVELSGEPSVREALVARLDALGVCSAGGACKVQVARADDRIEVQISLADGRATHRRVTDVDTAATLIESWSRDDLEPALPSLPARPPLEIGETGRPDAAPAVTPLGVNLSVAGDLTYAADQTVWFGLGLGACYELGPVCLGGSGRITIDTDEVGGSETYDSSRSGFDALATIEGRLDMGGSALLPGAGVGVAWLRTARDPLETGSLADHVVDTANLKINANLRWVWPINERLEAQLGVHADFVPGAHVDPFTLARVGAPPAEAAPEPRVYVRTALGLGYTL